MRNIKSGLNKVCLNVSKHIICFVILPKKWGTDKGLSNFIFVLLISQTYLNFSKHTHNYASTDIDTQTHKHTNTQTCTHDQMQKHAHTNT